MALVMATPSASTPPLQCSLDSASMCGSTTSSSVRLVTMPANDNRRPYCIITEPKACSDAYKELMWPTTEQNAGWDALQHLRQGNLRTAYGRPRRPSLDQRLVPVRRRGPLAVVVCSTDGCLQPCQVFDLEESDIVEVRVDGGVISESALASILMAVEVQGARLVLNLSNDRDAVCRMAVEEAVQSGTYVMQGGAAAPSMPSTSAKGEFSGVIQRCRTSSEATGQQHPLLQLVESVQPAVQHVAERRATELQQRRNSCPGAPLLHTDQSTLHDVCKAHAAFGAATIKSQLMRWLSPEVAAEVHVTSAMLACETALVHFHGH